LLNLILNQKKSLYNFEINEYFTDNDISSLKHFKSIDPSLERRNKNLRTCHASLCQINHGICSICIGWTLCNSSINKGLVHEYINVWRYPPCTPALQVPCCLSGMKLTHVHGWLIVVGDICVYYFCMSMDPIFIN
jgi:hypothetical protein